MTIEDIRGTVARGWCHEGNTHKEMDCVLAEAIAQEVNTTISLLLHSYEEDRRIVTEAYIYAENKPDSMLAEMLQTPDNLQRAANILGIPIILPVEAQ